jgi:hypothetical protein
MVLRLPLGFKWLMQNQSAVQGSVTRRSSNKHHRVTGYITFECFEANMDMRRLTTGLRSEKCFVRRFRPCANVIECNYTNLDCTV